MRKKLCTGCRQKEQALIPLGAVGEKHKEDKTLEIMIESESSPEVGDKNYNYQAGTSEKLIHGGIDELGGISSSLNNNRGEYYSSSSGFMAQNTRQYAKPPPPFHRVDSFAGAGSLSSTNGGWYSQNTGGNSHFLGNLQSQHFETNPLQQTRVSESQFHLEHTDDTGPYYGTRGGHHVQVEESVIHGKLDDSDEDESGSEESGQILNMKKKVNRFNLYQQKGVYHSHSEEEADLSKSDDYEDQSDFERQTHGFHGSGLYQSMRHEQEMGALGLVKPNNRRHEIEVKELDISKDDSDEYNGGLNGVGMIKQQHEMHETELEQAEISKEDSDEDDEEYGSLVGGGWKQNNEAHKTEIKEVDVVKQDGVQHEEQLEEAELSKQDTEEYKEEVNHAEKHDEQLLQVEASKQDTEEVKEEMKEVELVKQEAEKHEEHLEEVEVSKQDTEEHHEEEQEVSGAIKVNEVETAAVNEESETHVEETNTGKEENHEQLEEASVSKQDTEEYREVKEAEVVKQEEQNHEESHQEVEVSKQENEMLEEEVHEAELHKQETVHHEEHLEEVEYDHHSEEKQEEHIEEADLVHEEENPVQEVQEEQVQASDSVQEASLQVEKQVEQDTCICPACSSACQQESVQEVENHEESASLQVEKQEEAVSEAEVSKQEIEEHNELHEAEVIEQKNENHEEEFKQVEFSKEDNERHEEELHEAELSKEENEKHSEQLEEAELSKQDTEEQQEAVHYEDRSHVEVVNQGNENHEENLHEAELSHENREHQMEEVKQLEVEKNENEHHLEDLEELEVTKDEKQEHHIEEIHELDVSRHDDNDDVTHDQQALDLFKHITGGGSLQTHYGQVESSNQGHYQQNVQGSQMNLGLYGSTGANFQGGQILQQQNIDRFGAGHNLNVGIQKLENGQTWSNGYSNQHQNLMWNQNVENSNYGIKSSTSNVCSKSPCGLNSQCHEDAGRALCTCSSGFFGNPFTECKVGECQKNTDCPSYLACSANRCVNLCATSCGINAMCLMVEHEPQCSCPPGFTGNAKFNCRLIEAVEQCIPNPCGANTQCRIVATKPHCQCLPNYIGDPEIGCRRECEHDFECSKDKSCIDSKCQDSCKLCGRYAVCESVKVHKPVCKCPPDYFGNPYAVCKPECVTHADCPPSKAVCYEFKCRNPCDGACGTLAQCEVHGITAVCSCPKHLTGNPLILCRPYEWKDFCEPNPCGKNARCELSIDDKGAYIPVCKCLPGFYNLGTGDCVAGDCADDRHCPSHKSCEDFLCEDACKNQCGKGSICEAMNHTAVCSCPAGYKGNPTIECVKDVKKPCTLLRYCPYILPPE